MFIKQEFWNSSFWKKCRSLFLFSLLAKLYRNSLEWRNIILSKIFCPFYAYLAKGRNVALEQEKSKAIYVSLTSYPARINEAYFTICSILAQKEPVNKIILTLTQEEFPDGESQLPRNILALKKQGLEILWAEKNLKPHNKYFYAMQKYPHAAIITIDDDILYPRKTTTKLIKSYKNFPKAISALCTDKFVLKNGKTLPYSQSIACYDTSIHTPRFDLSAEGFAGVLYPPSILPKQAFDISAIQECSPLADDIWLKYMELLGNVPVVCASKYKDPIVVTRVQESALYKINKGNNQNDIQQQKIVDYFSHIDFEKKFQENFLS